MNVYLPGPIKISDMRGPAPAGFHIPLQTEWQGLITRMGQIDSDFYKGNYRAVLLHMPYAGSREYSSAGVSNQGNAGYYWSSTHDSTYQGQARYLWFTSTNNAVVNYNYCGYAYSIRCFKDSFELPTSSWTVIYGTLGSKGIFWNKGEGIISITYDGTTGYTIMDKNLGATTVYNSGDTLSEANCGKYYQWGNNYGFPRTGTISTTSPARIYADSYGPSNYYNSSIFRTSAIWDAAYNKNLWGGVSQGTSQGLEITELKNAYIGEYVPDFATRGPAPKGFHVPLTTEWQGLKTIMSGLGLTLGSDWRINLHMPFAGFRSWSSAKIGSQGVNGRYWMSSPVESSINHNDARYLWISSSTASENYADPRSQSYSVRCFKNSYVTPDFSWTVVQGTLGSAGIFRNQTKGLISITSDGTTGYTIQDKNLGATAVYNDGDTLSEANCGKYYQWGNNYGFPFTGSVTTSSTQVDTTGYGPGNYYSSSTFITRSGDYRDWSSVQNNNLRGGVDGNVPV